MYIFSISFKNDMTSEIAHEARKNINICIICKYVHKMCELRVKQRGVKHGAQWGITLIKFLEGSKESKHTIEKRKLWGI